MNAGAWGVECGRRAEVVLRSAARAASWSRSVLHSAFEPKALHPDCGRAASGPGTAA